MNATTNAAIQKLARDFNGYTPPASLRELNDTTQEKAEYFEWRRLMAIQKLASDFNGYTPPASLRELNDTPQEKAEYFEWRRLKDIVDDKMRGGATKKSTKSTTKWTSTGRKVTLNDGSKRALYKNAGKPGELRIRRMATRAGQTVATYVKPPK